MQRWLKFVKYLPKYGWKPIVYTPQVQNAPNYDQSLLRDIEQDLDVIRTPIWEPYSIYRFITGRKEKENLGAAFASSKGSNNFVEGISNWIRSNFFIPDARKFWIKPSIKFLSNYLRENPVDIVVTTGPPHSMHLIGLGIKKKLGLNWVADFRDPWTDIDFYNELKLTGWANRRHHILEKSVLENADLVISVSQSNRDKLRKKASSNIEVITNGYDPEDVEEVHVKLNDKFTIAHIGTFMENRNPLVLWTILAELVDEHADFASDFCLVLVGNTDTQIIKTIERHQLKDFLIYHQAVAHSEAVRFQKSSQVLLLSVNKSGDSKGMVTGKVFEYMISGRPILAIGPEDGDLAKILKETNTGVISDFENGKELKKNILYLYKNYKQGTLKTSSKNLSTYSREKLTGDLVGFFNQLIHEN